jgi:hypothetical protein
MTVLFELDLMGGPTTRRWRKALEPMVGRIEEAFPWDSLDPSDYDAQLVERGRVSWTASAFNEFCTAAAMGQLVELLGRANVPLDLWGVAATFPLEELLHVELCSRVAMRLGGGAPIVYDPADLHLDFEPGLSALQQANEMIVRLCCVGEAFSLPMLVGAMESATHPLTRLVLEQIVKDEALHGKLGWTYLEWVADSLDEKERLRLARAAEDTAAGLRRVWEGASAPGPEDPRASDMGWIRADRYGACARQALERDVFARLASHGIVTEAGRSGPIR